MNKKEKIKLIKSAVKQKSLKQLKSACLLKRGLISNQFRYFFKTQTTP